MSPWGRVIEEVEEPPSRRWIFVVLALAVALFLAFVFPAFACSQEAGTAGTQESDEAS